jgi:predicted nucleotide-binding protein
MSTSLQYSADRARELLNEAIQAGRDLLATGEDWETLASGALSWDSRNQTMLDQMFRTEGFLAMSPKSEYVHPMGLENLFGFSMMDDPTIEKVSRDIQVKTARLEAIRDKLELYVLEESGKRGKANPAEQRIFIVHGREVASRAELELLITGLTSVKPIVLGEQANQGSTIIEKLEEHLGSSSSFAVVLLTGDDEGGLKDEGEAKPRARQNVILELGYAMAALGRRRVAILYQEGVEIPSDILGLAYYELDSKGAWKTKIAGELLAAGFDVDATQLLP